MKINQAFKEWASVVDALAEGRQAVVFRKGGIHDPGGLFSPGPKDFWLYPTYEHQNADDLIPAERWRLAKVLGMKPGDGEAVLRAFAVVYSSARITDPAAVDALMPYQILEKSALEKRFEWGGEKGVFALLVRVYRLVTAATIEVLPSYGGCKSLITLEKEIEIDAPQPAIGDAEFSRIGRVFRSVSKG